MGLLRLRQRYKRPLRLKSGIYLIKILVLEILGTRPFAPTRLTDHSIVLNVAARGSLSRHQVRESKGKWFRHSPDQFSYLTRRSR